MSDINKYGRRYGSNDYKQAGYFGEIPIANGGVATEYSIGQDINGRNVEMPSIVPTLNYNELNAVKESANTGAKLPSSVYNKALIHAQERIKSGHSPFWGIPEKQYAIPKNINSTENTSGLFGFAGGNGLTVGDILRARYQQPIERAAIENNDAGGIRNIPPTPFKEWLGGVGERISHPLETMADYSRQFQRMSPVDQGLQLTGGGLAGSIARKIPKTQYELAHELAQRNAALPVEQGGLGLLANNTAMERAKAMGYQRADDGMDFMSEHRPPMSDSGAPLHDLTGGGNIYPDDVYSVNAARYYGTGDPTDNQLFRKIQSYKNKPEEKIRMFRAVPSDVMKSQGNTIHHGDWITPSRQYAVEHGESALGGDYRIQAGNFPAKSVFTNGDSPYEFGLDKSQYFADAPASVPLMRGTGFNSQDRSRFAAFDPLKRNSPDLLASLLPITTTGLLANQLRQSLWSEPQPD